MKRICTLLFLLGMSLGVVCGQETSLSPVIVVMSEQYDDLSIAGKTAFMDKQQRRAFVINDKKAFCQASQQEVLQLLESLDVEVVRSFWSFNGLSCLASQEVIRQLNERKDVAGVYLDEKKLMVPANERPKATLAKDYAWHIPQVNAPQVWNYNGTTGFTGDGVVIGHIDSGVNYNHIDLANSLWDGGSAFPHHGFDIVNNDNDPLDDHGHGSHTAGIVAGQGNAGTQTGVAPGAKIMAIKVINQDGEGSDTDAITGIEFALEHGADLISMSLSIPGIGGYGIYRDVFVTCLEAGVAAAVAASNEGQTQYAQPIPFNIGAPGNCPPPWLHPDQKRLITGGLSAVISVGATDRNDDRCDFSSVGPTTWAYGEYIGNYNDYPYENGDATQPGLIRPDLSAPGEGITSLNYLTNNGYIEYDGTSMATPCVAGVMAMLLQADPELSPAQLDSIIELTAAKIGNSSKNNRVGAGRIDALAAMNALFHHGPNNLTATLSGSTVFLTWEAAPEAVMYQVYRDGLRIANNLTNTSYVDHLDFGGSYTYYIVAQLSSDITSLPSNYVTVDKPVNIEADVINNSFVYLSWNMPTCMVDGFESGDFYENMWMIDQTYPWVISTTSPHEGNYCAASTNQSMFSTGKISLGVSVETNCVVSYYARISCFPLNGGGFFIDNVQVGETIKGEVPWAQYSHALTPGNHILEWKYANQLTEGEFENVFYIDDVMVGNPYNVYRANCDGSNQTLLASLVTTPNFMDEAWVSLPIGQYKYGISTDGGAHIAWSECLDKTYMDITENAEPGVQMYPNPASNQVTIVGEGLQRVSLVNLLGQVIMDQVVSSDILVLSLEDYPSGIYFVNVVSQHGTTVQKLTINH